MTSQLAGATVPTGLSAHTPLQRAVQMIRIHLVAWQGMLGWPLGILALVLTFNWALFALISDVTPPDGRTTGAVSSIYFVMGIGYLQTMTQFFPLALGLSVTRRAFYAGTVLLATAQAALFGVLLVVLKEIEVATDGWGIQLRFFDLPFLSQDNVLAQWLVFTVPFLAFAAVGMMFGVVFKRWGQTGTFFTCIGLGLVLAGAAILITWQNWWPEVGSFFASQSAMALVAGYPLVLAVVLGGAGYAILRRATP